MRWFQSQIFKLIHQNNLVYNTCWEDPRLDREALNFRPSDKVVMITSAGCNALDYILAGAGHVSAVDMNPRQNALLELKCAAAQALDYEDFFELFGRGRISNPHSMYQSHLRSYLSPFARAYWDRHISFFEDNAANRGFYFRGSSGAFARLVNLYVDRFTKIRDSISAALAAPDLESQAAIYEREVRPELWSRPLKFALNRDATLAMVGVPPAQRRQVEATYPGGIVKFVQDSVDAVFGKLSLRDNYFYRVYLCGEYTKDCCPEYLREENYSLLKSRVRDGISTHTDTLQRFLESSNERFSRFVLLDHMDWMSNVAPGALAAEWQSIVDHATDDARIIWRSGGLSVDFVDPIVVKRRGHLCRVGDQLVYSRELAKKLHAQDRVHTYGSFYIADLAAA